MANEASQERTFTGEGKPRIRRKREGDWNTAVSGDALLSNWLIFFPVPSNSPKVFAKINSAQFPSRSRELSRYSQTREMFLR